MALLEPCWSCLRLSQPASLYRGIGLPVRAQRCQRRAARALLLVPAGASAGVAPPACSSSNSPAVRVYAKGLGLIPQITMSVLC